MNLSNLGQAICYLIIDEWIENKGKEKIWIWSNPILVKCAFTTAKILKAADKLYPSLGNGIFGDAMYLRKLCMGSMGGKAVSGRTNSCQTTKYVIQFNIHA